MKCQKCNKQATVHITEIIQNKVHELHFCEDHAKEYLQHGETDAPVAGLSQLATALAEQLQAEQAKREATEIEAKTCPVCGMTFADFRSQGRLGCPHDYVEFAEELEQLLWNIHGADAHKGKRPKSSPGDTDERTDLIRLRREMQLAVKSEEYEKASQLRDRIRQIEQSWQKPQES
jgi:protein arginine kinase activator